MNVLSAELAFVDPAERASLLVENPLKIQSGLGGIAMMNDVTQESFPVSGGSTANEKSTAVGTPQGNGVEIREALRPVEAQSTKELLDQQEKPVSDGWTITFHGLEEGLSAYNASNVFMVGEGEDKVPHILVREEGSRGDQELTSRLTIWRCSADGRECWPTEISNLPDLVAGKIVQDPSVAYVRGQPVISWVEVTPPGDPNDPTQETTWESFACTGKSIEELEMLVATKKGSKTKGLRFVELLDHTIGIFARPDGDGRKKICFGIANDWKDITTEFLSSLKEVQGLSIGGEWDGPDAAELRTKDDIGPDQKVWGGANDAKLLPNGDISLAMHLAWYVDKKDINGNPIKDNRKYVGGHSVVEPPLGNEPAQAKYLKIIATREDFKISKPAKRPDLEDVIYTGFIITKDLYSPTSTLVASIGDALEAGLEIPNPLLNGWLEDHPEYAESSSLESADQQVLAA